MKFNDLLFLLFYFNFNRFISEIEAACRQWLADGPKNLLVSQAGPKQQH